jgi:hypothetical protein
MTDRRDHYIVQVEIKHVTFIPFKKEPHANPMTDYVKAERYVDDVMNVMSSNPSEEAAIKEAIEMLKIRGGPEL